MKSSVTKPAAAVEQCQVKSRKKLLLALFGPKCVTEVVYGNFTLLMDLVKLLSLQSYRLTERVVERGTVAKMLCR